MRVALDARTILGQKTGDRTYTLNLLRCLPEADPDLHLLALLNAPPPPELEAALSHERLEVVVAPAPPGKLWTAVALPRLAQRLKADLVHLQYIAPPWLPCPYVCTIHDITFRLFPEWFDRRDRLLMNWLIPRSVRRAAQVTVPSESTAADVASAYHVDESRVAVIPYAAPPEFSEPVTPEAVRAIREQCHLERDYFLFVGTLQPRKNLPRLLEASARADTQGADLAITGKHGWRQPELEGLVRSLGLSGRVRLLGYVPDESLPALYAGALAFLFPTLYEGFGIPVLEAMACGTPVLTSNVSALPEVAGQAALLVDPCSVEAIAEGITRLATDGKLRQELSAAGRRQAKRFSWEATARLTVEAYRRALP
jgi:glycosyltransferase involved in cell wall biosynthesis